MAPPSFNPLFCTLSPPSSVSHACKGRFTTTTSLVVAKSSSIDLHSLSEKGVQLVCTTPLFARIALVLQIVPARYHTHHLFVLSHSLNYAFLAYTHDAWYTVDHGSLVDRTGRKLTAPYLSFADPVNQCLGLILHQGILSVLPFPIPDVQTNPNKKQKQKLLSAPVVSSPSKQFLLADRFTLRLQELNTLSLTYLHQVSGWPTFAILFQDANGNRHIRSYTLNLAEKELKPGPIPHTCVARSAHLIVALPQGGILVFDHRAIKHIPVPSPNQTAVHQSNELVPGPCKLMRDSTIRTYSFIDDSRLIVGDLIGNYTLVHVIPSADSAVALEAHYLGSATTCTSLTYIDDGYVYLGSHYGDSALIRLLETPNADGSNLSVIQTYTNLGPITDFIVMDVPGTGNGGTPTQQVVTCSGAFHDGSLRIVRHGIELAALANLHLLSPPIRVLSASLPGHVPRLVVISLASATSIVLAVDPTSGDVTQLGSGFVTDEITLAIRFLNSSTVVQVTPLGIHVFSVDAHLENIHRINPRWNNGAEIRHAMIVQCGPLAYVVAAFQREIVQVVIDDLFECAVSPHGISDLETDVACMDIDTDLGLAAIGLWDRSVLIYTWPTWTNALEPALTAIHLLPDTEESMDIYQGIARSLIIASWRPRFVTVLAARANGLVVAYELEQVSGSSLRLVSSVPRVLTVGTEPVRLVRLVCHGEVHVFGACERPILLRASESGKISHSDVNLLVCLSSSYVPISPENGDDPWDALFVVTSDELIVSTMDQVENVHTTKIPLNGEMPRRILHHPTAKVLVVCTEKLDETKGKPLISYEMYADEIAFVRLMDEMTMEVVDSDQLLCNEAPQCICLHTVPNQEHALVVVGTAIIVAGEEEPSKGRILVYRIMQQLPNGENTRELALVSCTTVKGAVYSVACMSQKDKGLLVAGINNRVSVLCSPATFPKQARLKASTPITSVIVQESVPSYTSVWTASGFITALYLETHGDLVIVGDLMKSVTLFRYNRDLERLEVLAKDPSPSWVTAVAMVDEAHAVVSDAEHNVYVTKVCYEDSTARMEIPTEYHVGHFINKFRAGYLRAPSSDARVVPRFMSGSIDGRIGIMAHVPAAADFEKLVQLNRAIAERTECVGGFLYDEYRQFHSPRKVVNMHGAVDGDLLLRFLEMDVEVQRDLARVVQDKYAAGPVTPDELVRIVEDVARLR